MVSEGSDILPCVLWENTMVGKVWCGKAVHTTVDRKQRKTGRGQRQGIPKDPPLMTDLLSPTEPTSLVSTISQNVIINWGPSPHHSISKPQYYVNFMKSICCFYRGPNFSSPHHCGQLASACNSSFKESDILLF